MRSSAALAGGALIGATAGLAVLFFAQGSAAPRVAVGSGPAKTAVKRPDTRAAFQPARATPVTPTGNAGAARLAPAASGGGGAPLGAHPAQPLATGSGAAPAAAAAPTAEKKPRDPASANAVERGISPFREGLDLSKPVTLASPAGVTATPGEAHGLDRKRR